MLLVAGNLLFKIADLVIQRGVSLGVVVRLFLYYLPGVVVLTTGASGTKDAYGIYAVCGEISQLLYQSQP